jgi:tetratricopeptide (TPR) repeat protein
MLSLACAIRLAHVADTPNWWQLALTCVLGTSMLVLPAIASAKPVADIDDLARIWNEAVNLERTSWDLEESVEGLSYNLAIEAANRFEAVSEWLDAAPTPDLEPYRHAYWRTARAYWLAADSLELADRDRRREHLSRAIEFTDRGISVDPDCAACMLWKFNSMGRRLQIDGLFSSVRIVRTMVKLLDHAIALEPDFREGERSSTLGNLHYVSAVFYRVLPEWFWLKWIIGVRGDKQRALEHARTALALHESRIDYQIEVGSQLLCLGASKHNPKRLAEGRRALAEASSMQPRNLDDKKEIAAAHVMIAAPKRACSYAGAEWIEIDEGSAVSAIK